MSLNMARECGAVSGKVSGISDEADRRTSRVDFADVVWAVIEDSRR